MTLLTLFIIYFSKIGTPVSIFRGEFPSEKQTKKTTPPDTKMNTCYRRLIVFSSPQKKPGKYTNKFHLPGLF